MITVTREDTEAVWSMSQERCCFCRAQTTFWFVPKDVACCRVCAARASPEDVPTKAEWLARERIAMGVHP